MADRRPDISRHSISRLSLSRVSATLLLVSFLAPPSIANAQYPGAEPLDWPCEQRLIPALAWGSLWDGPSPDALEQQWWEDEEVGAVVRYATARETPRDAAIARVRRFAENVASGQRSADQNAEQRLTLLFAGLFERIDRERSRVIAIIRSAARAQVARLDRMSMMIDRLEAPNASETASEDAIERLQEALYWERQTFRMRQQALPAFCEKPYLLEESLSRMVRDIRSRM
nr:hypothetical protein [uncultured Halomonas sp.]